MVYQGLDRNCVYSTPSETRRLIYRSEHNWQHAVLVAPFRQSLRKKILSLNDEWRNVGHEVDTICHYYVLAKGMIGSFSMSLGEFDWAVKSSAQGAPMNGVGISNVADDVRKMRAIQATQISSTATSAARVASASTTQGLEPGQSTAPTVFT
jgi:hypothetical protein